MKRSAPLRRRAPLAPRRKRARVIKPERAVDPAHMARVATLPCLVCGAWPVEVHHNPEEALSDGPQAILPGELPDLFQDAAAIRALDPTRSTR